MSNTVKVEFIPQVEEIYTIDDFNYTETEILNEPMIFNGSIHWVRENEPKFQLANQILDYIYNYEFDALVEDQARRGYHPSIDTKSVLLMKDQYPCIGGWHCDGVIRNDMNSQPNINTVKEDIYHYIFTHDTVGNTPTDYVDINTELDVDADRVWASVDEEIKSKKIPYRSMKNTTLYKFNRSTIHRGQSAKEKTARFFFRLSFTHIPCANAERKQVQIYTDISKGW